MTAFETFVKAFEALGRNVYDLALCNAEGVKYHRFQSCNLCNDSYSVAKAFVMTAAGILCDEGKLRPEAGVLSVLGELEGVEVNPAWRLVTVDQVITHRIGYADDFLDIDAEGGICADTPDYMRLIFTHPMPYFPGSRYVYTDAAYYLLSRIVEHAAGMPAERFIRERILRPLDFREAAWSCDPLGHIIGASGLYASAADIVKLGWIYVNDGVWGQRRIISKRWIDRVCQREYEFRMLTPGGLYCKGGLHGQGLVFSRSGKFALCWHSYEDKPGSDAILETVKSLADD